MVHNGVKINRNVLTYSGEEIVRGTFFVFFLAKRIQKSGDCGIFCVFFCFFVDFFIVFFGWCVKFAPFFLETYK